MAQRRETLRARAIGLVLAALLGSAGCGSLIDSFSGRTEACEILAIGKPATGTIVRLIGEVRPGQSGPHRAGPVGVPEEAVRTAGAG